MTAEHSKKKNGEGSNKWYKDNIVILHLDFSKGVRDVNIHSVSVSPQAGYKFHLYEPIIKPRLCWPDETSEQNKN